MDACVLYPAPLRDVLIELSATDLYRAKWTAKIHNEWISNLLENRPDLTLQQLERTRDLMNAAVLDCMVVGYESLEEALELPDPDDRHVLAAAIHSGADAIVTMNLKDFPKEVVEKYDKEILHPDDFLHFQFELSEADFLTSVQRIIGRLKNPVISAEEYLETLELQGLPKTVSALSEFVSIL
ncbi:PIN domain-containing protein [Sphingorhabdus sp. YGSMI21]|uniref:PIN domain-containing protein n=1 Tax=Sphingorhabdus sp. YGSMI21 TaxID=2077182 RepID=UPI001F0BDF30|nr:PIN domain-containing protein [Sphingorhabdus sp. YGSMI21]